MATCLLTRKYYFRAIHRLRVDQDSFDEALHGHDYDLEVTVRGSVHPETGLIVDRDQLDSIVHETIIERYDGSSLNDDLALPSGELLCNKLLQLLNNTSLGEKIVRVCIQETRKNRFLSKLVHNSGTELRQ